MVDLSFNLKNYTDWDTQDKTLNVKRNNILINKNSLLYVNSAMVVLSAIMKIRKPDTIFIIGI